ncbi:hypothetical protein [Companilactobacillus ginsenosidimutans]|uniref:GRAM domain-containing protein n=1 Tax=Companilactobacillus ginsenosidimutans TaxID=1007676 RepID=A0A0H4QI24_9LACO|nr:hypothetical protein [Companilactobacillus ginsenosidimutans]AKP66293.1 hypothetical protein ABM34_01155 [Companilactobacillus ginsenosidimutans]
MFSYIQIIDENDKLINGYASYKFSDGVLSLSFMNGWHKTIREEIPLSEVSHLSQGGAFDSRISFDFAGKHFVFLDSGFGEAQFFKDGVIEAVRA